MNGYPQPGSADELNRFRELQDRLPALFGRVLPDRLAPRTVVVVPSISLDEEALAKITGIRHYEERLLCLLLLLRLPRTRVVYVTSTPIESQIVDYYLQFLQGVPTEHARRRLTLFSCSDSTPQNLTQKILARPRLLQRIRDAIPHPESAHLSYFNACDAERTLAVQLGIPMYACDPALAHLGTKSGSRRIFRDAGVCIADGVENLRDEWDVAQALAELKRRNPDLRKAVVKRDDGTSGEGNAVFSFEGSPTGHGLNAWIRTELPSGLAFGIDNDTFDAYFSKFREQGGIIESWIEGRGVCSPSMQGRIDPLRRVEPISTHDQILGGASGQMFLGSTFPARREVRLGIQEAGMRIGRALEREGALGRFGVDFVSVRNDAGWEHFATEINLRKGGTTHTFRTLQLLTDGNYDPESGLFRTPEGHPRYYHASDNLKNPDYRRLTPEDLIDVAVEHGLHFHGLSQQGVVFYLLGAISTYGKLGVLCVGDSPESASELFDKTRAILDREACDEPPPAIRCSRGSESTGLVPRPREGSVAPD